MDIPAFLSLNLFFLEVFCCCPRFDFYAVMPLLSFFRGHGSETITDCLFQEKRKKTVLPHHFWSGFPCFVPVPSAAFFVGLCSWCPRISCLIEAHPTRDLHANQLLLREREEEREEEKGEKYTWQSVLSGSLDSWLGSQKSHQNEQRETFNGKEGSEWTDCRRERERTDHFFVQYHFVPSSTSSRRRLVPALLTFLLVVILRASFHPVSQAYSEEDREYSWCVV